MAQAFNDEFLFLRILDKLACAIRDIAEDGLTIKLVLPEGMDKRRLDELHGQVQDLILSEVPKE